MQTKWIHLKGRANDSQIGPDQASAYQDTLVKIANSNDNQTITQNIAIDILKKYPPSVDTVEVMIEVPIDI